MREAFASSIRAHPNLWGWFANFLFCVAVGIAVSFAVEAQLASIVMVSCSIGFSVQACIHFGLKFLAPRVKWYFVVAAMLVTGIVIGLMIGGAIVAGRPALFFRDNSSVLAFALLFGSLGTIGFWLLDDLWAAQRKLAEAERNALLRGKALAEAELRVLQAQMEPHFLFNTLSNVISLIKSNPNRAERLLEQLTLVLRAALNRTRAADSTLGDELDLVRAYLEVQAHRMDGRLEYSIAASPEIAGIRLSPLLVQPLVENAILHGIEPSVDGGKVQIAAERVGDEVRISVQDNGIGLDDDDFGSQGECIANIRERLLAMYGEKGNLKIAETPKGGVCVQIRVPADDASC